MAKEAGFKTGSAVGGQSKADLRGAGLMGESVVGESSLARGVKELHDQHPIKHDDLGPHHGDMSHVWHAAMGGMRPSGKE